MKTTIDIATPLLEDARKVAARDGTTLRSLVEQGLRHVLAASRRAEAFQMRRATFAGRGLQPEFAGETWDRVREVAYGDRGG